VAKQKKKWSDLSPLQQKAIIVIGTGELILTTVALRDLRRRPAAQVRGPKLLWTMACGVQPFGPVAYLVKGRRALASQLRPDQPGSA